VSATDRLVASVVSEVEGYPYFINLWGAEIVGRRVGSRGECARREATGGRHAGHLSAPNIDFYERESPP